MAITPTPGQVWYHARSATAPTAIIVAVTPNVVRFQMTGTRLVFSVPPGFFESTYKPVMMDSGEVLTIATTGSQ